MSELQSDPFLRAPSRGSRVPRVPWWLALPLALGWALAIAAAVLH